MEKAARNNEKIQLREFFFRARELHRLALRIEIMLTSVNNIRDIVAKGSVNKMLKLFAIEQLKSFAKRIKN